MPHFLIVEDDADSAELLLELFATAGLEVTWAKNGEEALGQLRSAQWFEAALIDLSLPDLDGAEVVAAARRLRPSIRLAVWTGFAPEAIEGPLLQQIDQLFEKPSDPDELLRFARQALMDAHPLPPAGGPA